MYHMSAEAQRPEQGTGSLGSGVNHDCEPLCGSQAHRSSARAGLFPPSWSPEAPRSSYPAVLVCLWTALELMLKAENAFLQATHLVRGSDSQSEFPLSCLLLNSFACSHTFPQVHAGLFFFFAKLNWIRNHTLICSINSGTFAFKHRLSGGIDDVSMVRITNKRVTAKSIRCGA